MSDAFYRTWILNDIEIRAPVLCPKEGGFRSGKKKVEISGDRGGRQRALITSNSFRLNVDSLSLFLSFLFIYFLSFSASQHHNYLLPD